MVYEKIHVLTGILSKTNSFWSPSLSLDFKRFDVSLDDFGYMRSGLVCLLGDRMRDLELAIAHIVCFVLRSRGGWIKKV